MNGEGKDGATGAVVRLQAGGGTSIAAGLDAGLTAMEHRRQRNNVSAVLLLTDGQDSSTRHLVPSLVTRAERERCSLYAFGFGSDHDAALLSYIAEQARTPFSFVDATCNKIREAFAGAVSGLASVVAQELELCITSRVPLKALHTPFATRHESNMEATVTIPDIFAGERKDIVVELAVPMEEEGAGNRRSVLFEVVGRYIDLRLQRKVLVPTVVMEAERVQEPQPEAEPDEEVCGQRERVQVTRALQEAGEHGNRGNFAEAQRVLDAAQQILRPPSSAPISAALGQQLQEARSQMQNEAMWEQRGRAMVSDSCQMNQVQRSTNISLSSAQGMYCMPQQQSMIFQSRSC